MTPEQARGLASILISSGTLVPHRRGPTRHAIAATWSSSIKDADYFHEKVEAIKALFPTKAEPTLVEIRPSDTDVVYPVLRFTFCTDKINPLYHLFVPRGTRRITSAALELCGAKAVAWLWSDHGHRVSDGLEIRSFARTPEEYILVAQWMQILLGARCVAYVKGKRKRLFFDAANAAKAAEQLLDYCPETRRDFFLQVLDDALPVCLPSLVLRPGRKRRYPAAWVTRPCLDPPSKARDRVHVS